MYFASYIFLLVLDCLVSPLLGCLGAWLLGCLVAWVLGCLVGYFDVSVDLLNFNLSWPFLEKF